MSFFTMLLGKLRRHESEHRRIDARLDETEDKLDTLEVRQRNAAERIHNIEADLWNEAHTRNLSDALDEAIDRELRGEAVDSEHD